MNLREEVTYFVDYDVGIILPIALSFMIIPSILINIFPFIIFISSMWVLIKLKNNGEILSLKTFGFSNARFLSLLGISSFFLGVIVLLAFNPVTSLMVKYYEDIKGSYDLDKSHLASITNNGVWIKEEIGSKINFINSIMVATNIIFHIILLKMEEKIKFLTKILIIKSY